MLKEIYATLITWSGILHLQRLLNNSDKSKVIILMYHRITNGADDALDSSVVSVTVENFDEQMLYLSRHAKVIDFGRLKEMQETQNVDGPYVIVTFDDGYRDNYDLAFPILKKYGIPATIFLSTDGLDTKELFWWDKVAFIIHKTSRSICLLPDEKAMKFTTAKTRQACIGKIQSQLKRLPDAEKNAWIEDLTDQLDVTISKHPSTFLEWDHVREMTRSGISFGAHTLSHPIMTNISIRDAQTEIVESRNRIEEETGRKVSVFAYPNGHEGDMDPAIDDILSKEGFDFVLSANYKENHIEKGSFKLDRFGIDIDDTLGLFKMKVAGLGRLPAMLYVRFLRQ